MTGRPANILAAGSFDLGAHPRARVLIEGLRDHGIQVEEIVEPLRMSTAQRVEALQNPLLLVRLAWSVGRSWIRLAPRLVRRRLRGPRPDAVLVGYLGHFDVGLVRVLTRRSPVILDHLISGADTARDRGVLRPGVQTALKLLDETALRCADIVLVDTEEHLRLLPERHRDRAIVVPVGADHRWSRAARVRGPRATPAGGPARPMSVIFFGMFTPLQGATTIAAALKELGGDVTATLIGTGQDWNEAKAILGKTPGITWVPWVSPDDLPAVVSGHDVCLGIFGTGDKARRVVPNKVYQGAAAGCVVVTSDTPAQRRALGEDAVFVPPGDGPALAAALRNLAEQPELRDHLAARAANTAERFSPANVVAPLLDGWERLA